MEIADTETDADVPLKQLARARGFRSVLYSPLMSKGAAIGVISVTRTDPGSFHRHHVQLLQTFADQAVIAIENVRLFNETKEALERQTATSEILRVISQSPTDVQPVFDAIVLAAVRLIHCDIAFFLRCDATTYTPVARATSEGLQADIRPPQPIDPDVNFPSRAIVAKQTLHLPDWSLIELPEYERRIHETFGVNSSLYLPLEREGECIGLFALAGKRANIFGENEITLAESFRDQALIAIENTRLFNEVKERTEDLSESLQQQTATADVLKVISRSTFDLQTVLDTLVESATRLCEADHALLFQRNGEFLRFAASFGFGTDVHLQVREMFLGRKMPIDRGSITGRSALEARVLHVTDVLTDPEYTWNEAQRIGGHRAALGAPLLRDGKVVGVIFVAKTVAQPFTSKQIELVSTFADQAVIAIENVRLFDEVQAKTRDLTEALTYQTGSANILSVIASSPTDVGPVLKAIVESACELCDADDAIVFLKDGDDLRSAAHSGPIAEGPTRIPINRTWMTGRSFLDRKPVHCARSSFCRRRRIPKCAEDSTQRRPPNDADGAVVARGRKHWSDHASPQGSPSLQRQTDCLASNLRRPGGDRDWQCPAVRGGAGENARPHGVAAAADRDRRRAEGHQHVRRATCSPCSKRCWRTQRAFAGPILATLVCEGDAFRLGAPSRLTSAVLRSQVTPEPVYSISIRETALAVSSRTKQSSISPTFASEHGLLERDRARCTR